MFAKNNNDNQHNNNNNKSNGQGLCCQANCTIKAKATQNVAQKKVKRRFLFSFSLHTTL